MSEVRDFLETLKFSTLSLYVVTSFLMCPHWSYLFHFLRRLSGCTLGWSSGSYSASGAFEPNSSGVKPFDATFTTFCPQECQVSILVWEGWGAISGLTHAVSNALQVAPSWLSLAWLLPPWKNASCHTATLGEMEQVGQTVPCKYTVDTAENSRRKTQNLFSPFFALFSVPNSYTECALCR